MAERQTPGLANITLRDYLRVYLDDMRSTSITSARHTDNDIVIHLPTRDADRGRPVCPIRAVSRVIDYAGRACVIGRAPSGARRAPRLRHRDPRPQLTDRNAREGYKVCGAQEMVREMNKQKKTRDEISAVLSHQIRLGRTKMQVGLDGVITEMR
jgi:hypothetical protein